VGKECAMHYLAGVGNKELPSQAEEYGKWGDTVQNEIEEHQSR